MNVSGISKLFLLFVFFGLWSCKTEPVLNNPEEISIRLQKDPVKLNPIIYPRSGSREI